MNPPPGTRCPHCARQLENELYEASGKRTPPTIAPGDLIVCVQCGNLAVFSESLNRLRAVDADDLADLDAEQVRELAGIRFKVVAYQSLLCLMAGTTERSTP